MLEDRWKITTTYHVSTLSTLFEDHIKLYTDHKGNIPKVVT
jgi:hypothetical protein